MIIIGEKINGAIPKTAKAIEERDAAYIIELVNSQIDAGVDYLDVCAGTAPEKEYDAICWLLEIVQAHTDTPLCIDSPDPYILEKIFPLVKRPGIINSVSLEGEKREVLFPLMKEHPEWLIVALCCDSKGVTEKAEDKARLAFQLIEDASGYGIGPERIHIDPLVLALSAVGDSSVQFCDAVRMIKKEYPAVNVTAALSNISFGMPLRGLLNRNFLALAMASGLDSVIADPTNREVTETVYAVDALLNRDRCCRKYTNAFRKGKIGSAKNR